MQHRMVMVAKPRPFTDPTQFEASPPLLLLVRRTSHHPATSLNVPRTSYRHQLPSIMSDNESIATSTARKRSRSPSSVKEPTCTKLSRQSSSPPGGLSADAIPESSCEEQHTPSPSVGVTQPSKPLLIYIVNKKIPSSQLAHLKGIAKKKEFPLSATITDDVTHIISALPSFERTQTVLDDKIPPTAEVITLEWLTTSFAEGKPTQVTDRYRLRKSLPVTPKILAESKASPKPVPFTISEYECQRPTLLEHHNHVFTDALEALEQYYQHVDYKQKDTRALAFRQASCVLKALPRKVTHISQVAHLHRIGPHSAEVIEDILRNGFSSEVAECKKNEWYKSIQFFSSIYGCGTATADKWYKKGIRTLNDIKQSTEINLTDTQRVGIEHYHHLVVPVARDETEYIRDYVLSQAEICFPGTTVEAVGGYRRGKRFSHDVDLLLSHADHKVTDILLDTLVDHLKRENVIIDIQKFTSQYSHSTEERRRSGAFDSLDKAFCILRLDSTGLYSEPSDPDNLTIPTDLIRRVDLIVSPPDQYPFALVSWTGSKQFNRSLRRYSDKELNMSVTAHGIHDRSQAKYIPATSEEEVFSILKLKYLQPWERNC